MALTSPTSQQIEAVLRQDLAALPPFLEINDHHIVLLTHYIELLALWNQTYNLTAITDPLEMVTRHLLDSLVIAPYLTGNSWIDVGSGAGLPGIPLAIIFPEKKITLLDSNGKKTRFLQHVKQCLSLHNITVIHARAEQFTPPHLYDCILTRAFAALPALLKNTQHLLQAQGVFAAMKAAQADNELKQLPAGFDIQQHIKLHVPKLNEVRTLLLITHNRDLQTSP